MAVPLVLVSPARAVTLAALVSAVAGITAVGIAVWAALRQPSVDDPDASRSPAGEASEGVSNEVSGTVHGDVVQARDVQGGVRFDPPS